MINQNELNEDYVNWMKEDMDAHMESAQKELSYLAQSTAKYHGRCVSTLYIPKMFTPADIACFENLIEELYGIFDKVIEEYLYNEEYRRLFGFSDKLEELILRTPYYDCKIPIARIDIFYDEKTKDFTFCEFNTDGSSAMNEDRELNEGLKYTKGYQELEKRYAVSAFELFDSWVRESMRIYYSTKHTRDNPHIAIVDFMENATNNEFEIFAQTFREYGVTCEICEIRALKYKDGKLYGNSKRPIDLIYRRAVTSDIMKHYNEVIPFITAVIEEAVCLVGDFTTQIVHNKVLYQVLHDPMTKKLLTEKEQEYVKAHIPYTADLSNADIPYNDIINNREDWIIKPKDSYGSKGVFAGVEFEDFTVWKQTVETHRKKDYIVQKFQQPYQTKNIDFAENSQTDFIMVSNLTGLFVYGGKFSGIYSRVSRDKIISTQYSEIALPSILVDDKDEDDLYW